MRFVRFSSFAPLLSILVFAAGFLGSCAGQPRDGNIREFLNCLKDNDQQKIYAISYHVNSRNNITDDDSRKQFVAVASRVLHTYVVSPRGRWSTEQIYGGSSRVSIPLVAGSDTTVRVTIILSFPPPSVSDKVYNFNISKSADAPKGGIAAPQRINP